MIEIYTEELPSGWEWSPHMYVGGTPEFAVEVAESAKKLTEVIVYYDGCACQWNGINYLPRKYFMGKDIVLACNSVPPRLGKYSILWTALYGKKDFEYLNFDERIVLSPYHQSLFGDKSRIVPLSCHSERFKGGEKVKGHCLYSSSPDRGGEFLKSIWEEVARATGAKLIHTYKASISEKDMVELYKSSEFWLHPCQGIELFCISAVKAQCAGCIPVVVPNMALETTVKYGVKTTLENYKDDLIKAILNPPKAEAVDFGSWDLVTRDIFKAVI